MGWQSFCILEFKKNHDAIIMKAGYIFSYNKPHTSNVWAVFVK